MTVLAIRASWKFVFLCLPRKFRAGQLGLLSINFDFQNVIFQPMVFPLIWAKYKLKFMTDCCKPSFPCKSLTSALSRRSLCSPKQESLLPVRVQPQNWRKCLLNRSASWMKVGQGIVNNMTNNGFIEVLKSAAVIIFWAAKWKITVNFSLTNCCTVVPTSAVHHFSFKWDIVHVVKAAIIAISVLFNLSTLLGVSHVLSIKVSPK